MEDNRGSIMYFLISFIASFSTLYFTNGLKIPNDGKKILITTVIALTIAFFWCLVRGVQENDASVIAYLLGALVTAILASGFVGWIENLFNGELSWAVDVVEICTKYAITLAFVIFAQFALAPELIKAFLSALFSWMNSWIKPKN